MLFRHCAELEGYYVINGSTDIGYIKYKHDIMGNSVAYHHYPSGGPLGITRMQEISVKMIEIQEFMDMAEAARGESYA